MTTTHKVSSHYRVLTPEQLELRAPLLKNAWKHAQIPIEQWLIVSKELEDYGRGVTMRHFDALVNAVCETKLANPRVLDVGAASAFYSEVLRIAGIECDYEALDYSVEFANFARSLYPKIRFTIADAARLPFDDGHFEIVMTSACIMHSVEYAQVIQECARVANRYMILHRTPVLLREIPTVFYEKDAYGVACIEAHFNARELLAFCDHVGLDLVWSETLFVDFKMSYESKTFLFKKR